MTNLEGDPVGFSLPADLDPLSPLDQSIGLPGGRFLLRQGNTVLLCLANGTPDPNFAKITFTQAEVNRCTIDAQGRVYLVSSRHRPHPYLNDEIERRVVCVRYLSDGSSDPDFRPIGADSIYGSNDKEWDYDLRIVPLDDSRIVVLQNEGGSHLDLAAS